MVGNNAEIRGKYTRDAVFSIGDMFHGLALRFYTPHVWHHSFPTGGATRNGDNDRTFILLAGQVPCTNVFGEFLFVRKNLRLFDSKIIESNLVCT